LTIIVTALLPDHVIQVSDRKLTWSVGTKVVRQEDRWNKATVFGDWATIAYTGPARLSDQRTDQWITETISPVTAVDEAICCNGVNHRLTASQSSYSKLAPGQGFEP
jgi:hypothetical protein